MIEPLVFLKGILFGLAVAAPVGPISILCIRRTLAEGGKSGFVSGLGAATADGIYAAISAFGVTTLAGLLTGGHIWFRISGIAFLAYLGVNTFLTKPAEQVNSVNRQGLWKNYGSTFFLTLTNPLTIISFAALFASAGIGMASQGYWSAVLTVLGIITGSMLWWVCLSYGISRFRTKIKPRGFLWINRISGITIIGFAAAAAWMLL
ncbi:MAG: LysE family transporter [Dehalococcoidales bacterium]|nr:LysE family transporter [Dehalococcoidales bacterium]